MDDSLVFKRVDQDISIFLKTQVQLAKSNAVFTQIIDADEINQR
jgi:hypothetical protein